MTPEEVYTAARGCWVVGRKADTQAFLIASYRGVVRLAMTIDGWTPAGKRWAAEGRILAAGHPVYDMYVGKASPVGRSHGNPVNYFDSPLDTYVGDLVASRAGTGVNAGLPTPSSGDQRVLMQAVWDAVSRLGWWPTFNDLDKALWAGRKLDVLKVAKTMPDGLLLGGLASLSEPPPEHVVKLSAAGVAACHHTDEVLRYFVETIRLAVDVSSDSANAETRIDPVNITAGVNLPAAGREVLLQQIGALINAESSVWTGFVGPNGPGDWFFMVGRKIRVFDGILTINEFWEIAHADEVARRQAAELADDPDVATSSQNDAPAARPSSPDLVSDNNRLSDTEMQSGDYSPGVPIIPAPDGIPVKEQRVFLVHGHDDSVKTRTQQVLNWALGDVPVTVLHQQPNSGATIIEKFEAAARSSTFVVVVLTADDTVVLKDGTERKRARQNVIYEMGYFHAALQRKNVVALHVPEVEVPSDLSGMLYLEYDNPNGAWRAELLKELDSAGFAVNWREALK